jgi:hypothetical protein
MPGLTGPWSGSDGNSEGPFPASEYATPAGPLPLEIFVEGFLADEVAPQPRYPAPPVSPMSWLSPCGLETPTAGMVGLLLGLNPYSSTSFRRSSSAFFCCLRLLHKKSRARTIRATLTTGTTTATAVFPPLDRPPLPEEELDCVASAGLEVFEVGAPVVVVPPDDTTGIVVAGCVEVKMMVVGGRLVLEGVMVWVMADGEGVETTEETVTCEKVVGAVATGVVEGLMIDGVLVEIEVGVTDGTIGVGVVGAAVDVGVGTMGVVEVTATGLVEVDRTVTGGRAVDD